MIDLIERRMLRATAFKFSRMLIAIRDDCNHIYWYSPDSALESGRWGSDERSIGESGRCQHQDKHK